MCDYKKLFIDALELHQDHTKWINADFRNIKTISNTKVGSVGQEFIERISSALEIKIDFPVNKYNKRLNQSPWDIEINGVKFELKTATEDVNGCFQFNHVRYHRKYEALLCLGVSPNNLYFGLWSKADITTTKAGNLVSMEKNANASYKLTKKPNQLYPIEDFSHIVKEFTENFCH